jgi:predicted DNA-binding protein
MSDRREQRTVYFGADQIRSLIQLSAETGASQATIVRAAVDHYLKLVDQRRADGRPPRELLVDED